MVRQTILACALICTITSVGSQKHSLSPHKHSHLTRPPSPYPHDFIGNSTNDDRTIIDGSDLSNITNLVFDDTTARGTLPSGREFIAKKNCSTVTVFIKNQHTAIKLLLFTTPDFFDRLQRHHGHSHEKME